MQRQQLLGVVLARQKLVLLEVVLLDRLGLCDLLWPLLTVACATAAQSIHEYRRAGGFLAAEGAVLTAPLQQFAERSLTRRSLCGLIVLVLSYGAILVEKVVGPVVCVLVESFAGRGEAEEIGRKCCGTGVRRVGLVGNMGCEQIRGNLLCDFWRKRSEVVARMVVTVTVAAGVWWGGEDDTSHTGRHCHPVLLG